MQFATKEALAALIHRGERHVTLTNALKDIWGNTEQRLKLVTESDPQLSKIIEAEKKISSRHWNTDNFLEADIEHEVRSNLNDMRSDFTRGSRASFLSSTSVKSGLSTVSVLSNLSRQSSSASVVSDASSFSVRGLEHSLLSRGNASDSYVGNKSSKSAARIKKRHERHQKGNKGGAHGGADIHNLKGENAWCTELCKYCDIKSIAAAVVELRDTLVILGGVHKNIELAINLQKEMDNYTALIATNPPPTAPLYPIEWLRRKNMAHVRCFQEWPEHNGDDSLPTVGASLNVTVSALLWWKIAADGILHWRSSKDVVLGVS